MIIIASVSLVIGLRNCFTCSRCRRKSVTQRRALRQPESQIQMNDRILPHAPATRRIADPCLPRSRLRSFVPDQKNRRSPHPICFLRASSPYPSYIPAGRFASSYNRCTGPIKDALLQPYPRIRNTVDYPSSPSQPTEQVH